MKLFVNRSVSAVSDRELIVIFFFQRYRRTGMKAKVREVTRAGPGI